MGKSITGSVEEVEGKVMTPQIDRLVADWRETRYGRAAFSIGDPQAVEVAFIAGVNVGLDIARGIYSPNADVARETENKKPAA